MQQSSDLRRLIEIMAALRTPGTGCPWDLEQTHASLAPYALEEAYEVVDAIERGHLDDLCDELGDLLLQVVFHARLAEETGAFAFGDVVAGVTSKMLRRHPHVFEARKPPASGVGEVWEAIKADERRVKSGAQGSGAKGLLADVPKPLPGLTRAVKLQKKASTVGFDWGDAKLVLAKVREEIDELERELDNGDLEAAADEIGDLIFAVANLARHAGADPEAAVCAANAKFERRFAHIEQELAARGSCPQMTTLAEMEALWIDAKKRGL